jgi:hypothetical protein
VIYKPAAVAGLNHYGIRNNFVKAVGGNYHYAMSWHLPTLGVGVGGERNGKLIMSVRFDVCTNSARA